MVHDHEEGQPNTRKRSYPFIEWMSPSISPPQSRASPDKNSVSPETFPPSLPSPPLMSNKYRAFKQGLDRFGGSGLKPAPDRLACKRKPSWGEGGLITIKKEDLAEEEEEEETDGGMERVSSLTRNEEEQVEERGRRRVKESDDKVTSSGQAFEQDREVKGNSLQHSPEDQEDRDEEPRRKKPKYSATIEVDKVDDDEEIFQPSIAESIKLRDPGKNRRNRSESYDESDAKTIRKIIAAGSVLKDKKSSTLYNTYKLGSNKNSCHPYVRKPVSNGGSGAKIKVVSRTSPVVGNGTEPTKIYIQIPQPADGQENKAIYGTNIIESSPGEIKNDKNHNKFKETNYVNRQVTVSTLNGDTKYSKPKMSSSPSRSTGQRPSSTVVSSSTEINGEDVGGALVKTEVDTIEGKSVDRQPSQASKALYGARVILQAAGASSTPTVTGFWQQQPQPQQQQQQGVVRHQAGKDRPTPYSLAGGDRSFKQASRSRKFNTRYPAPEKPRQKRAVIQDMVRPLKQWLLRHRHNPYPTKAEKVQLAVGSNMTLVQVSNWFANARRRLKNVVQESRCSWSKRLRLYNRYVQGNAELLSISSDDSIWNSEDDEGVVSDTGNTDDFEDDADLAGGLVDDHPYASLPGLGCPEGGQPGELTIDLSRRSSVDNDREYGSSTIGSHGVERRGSDSVSTRDRGETEGPESGSSGTPPGSPPDPHNTPDTPKFKSSMLHRYLNDAAEARESFLTDRNNSQSSGQQSAGSGSDEEFYHPDQSDISVGREELVYPAPGPGTPPEAGDQAWQQGVVDGNLIPPASNNITIHFTNSSTNGEAGTSQGSNVPVISQPPRDSMGVDKVKRQLDLGVLGPQFSTHTPIPLFNGSLQLPNGHIYQLPNSPPTPPPANQGHPASPLFAMVSPPPASQAQFSSSVQTDTKLPSVPPHPITYPQLPQHPVKGEPLEVGSSQGTSNGSSVMAGSMTSTKAPPIFPSHPIYRPPISVLPSYPFFPSGPLPGWAPPFAAPFPFLLLPDSSLNGGAGGHEQPTHNLAPPSWLVPGPHQQGTTTGQGATLVQGPPLGAGGPPLVVTTTSGSGGGGVAEQVVLQPAAGSPNWTQGVPGARQTVRFDAEMHAALALSELAYGTQPVQGVQPTIVGPLHSHGGPQTALHLKQAQGPPAQTPRGMKLVSNLRQQPPTCT